MPAWRAGAARWLHPGSRSPSRERRVEHERGSTRRGGRPDDGCPRRARHPARRAGQALRRLHGRRPRRPRRRARRVLHDARPVRLGQDHDAAAHRRLRVPDEGRVELGGEDVARRPPFERDVNTVFQDYALFPHMSVLDNVAYGLKIKKRRPRRAPREGARGARDGAPPGRRRPQARAALGRPAPARRARARDRQPPARPAARRAARRAGPQAARGDAGRAQAHPAARSASPSST